jgi:hypothetical protein
MNTIASDHDSLHAVEKGGEAGGWRREHIPARSELELEPAPRHEGGGIGPEQSRRHHDLVALPGHFEGLHQANAFNRQVGLEGDDAGGGLLREGRGEAQVLEIHHGKPGGRAGVAEDEPWLWRIVGAGESDRCARCRVGLRTRRMAGSPRHGTGAVEGEDEVEPVRREVNAVGRRLAGGGGRCDGAPEEEQCEDPRRYRQNRLIS